MIFHENEKIEGLSARGNPSRSRDRHRGNWTYAVDGAQKKADVKELPCGRTSAKNQRRSQA